jgi:hypothetical protein
MLIGSDVVVVPFYSRFVDVMIARVCSVDRLLFVVVVLLR